MDFIAHQLLLYWHAKTASLNLVQKVKPSLNLGFKSYVLPTVVCELCSSGRPAVDATHVRNAVARFDQVKDVSDAERDEAWKRIQAAAKKFGVELNEKSWRELGKGSS